MTFLLCDPGWYVHKPDVQNKWEDKTRQDKTHYYIPYEVKTAMVQHKILGKSDISEARRTKGKKEEIRVTVEAPVFE